MICNVFCRFPRNETLQKLWKDNIGTENIKPFKVAKVCSKHFEDNCINRTLDVVRLKDDVVPTLFPVSIIQLLPVFYTIIQITMQNPTNKINV